MQEVHQKIYVGECNTAAATAEKEVTVEAFPLDSNNKPIVGTVIAVKFSKTNSANNPTLNVNSIGAEHIWYNANVVTESSYWAGYANRYIYYVWDGTNWAVLSWGYDTNDSIASTLRTGELNRTLSYKISRYVLLFSSKDNTQWVPSNTSYLTNSTAVRTVNQTPIDPFGPIAYYGGSTVKNQNETVAANALWMQNTVSLGYSFNNTGSAWNMTLYDSVYLKCTPQSDGSAIMDANEPIVFSLPSTEDGKIYIYLGGVYSETYIVLYAHHPVYYYKDGAIRLWTGVPIDSTPTQNSTNLITSGGVYAMIKALADANGLTMPT